MSIKILIISHSFSPCIGGIEIISEILAQQFVLEGHKVHLLTWSNGPDREFFPFKIIRNPGLSRLLREHKWADLVFENNPTIRLSWPAILYKKPSIIGLQTWITRTDGRKSFRDQLKLKWLKRASLVISCSNAIRQRCFPESVVIQNPYQENVFTIQPKWEKSRDFVFLGRMVSDKGADLAIKAFQQISTNHNGSADLKMTMVGEGPERKPLEKLVSDLKLDGQITFTGSLKGDDLVKCLNEHRFLLVPSRWEEPFGIVVLEGLACGCIPIVSDGGGLPEAVGSAGVIFKRGDIEDLVLCMQRVLKEKELVKYYSEQAQPHLTSHRSSVVAKQYLKKIEGIIEKSKSSEVGEISV